MIRGDLYEWIGVDRHGKATPYQTHGPDVTEAQMREHLQRHYPGLTITSIKRVGVHEFKPQAEGVEVAAHAFMRGTRDAAVDALASLSPARRTEFLLRDVPRQSLDERQVQTWLVAAELLNRRIADEQQGAAAPRQSILDKSRSVIGEARLRNQSVLRFANSVL